MKIVILAAHADDETLGAGGFISKLLGKGHELSIVVASDGIVTTREGVSLDNLTDLRTVCKFYGISRMESLGFKDQYFDNFAIADIAIAASEAAGEPDLIISHSSNDLNKDHQIMSEVARIIGRPIKKPVSILAMEIGVSTPWGSGLFQPGLYVDITNTIDKKLQALSLYTHEVRQLPHPTSAEGFKAMARSRGMAAGCKFAEAFEVVRLHDQHLANF